MAKLLVIDNYDSFTYNLVQMFSLYDLSIIVSRSDKISLTQATDVNPDYLLISPGPKDPTHAGMSCYLIEAFCRQIPILGVCLGMQCINEIFGGQTIQARKPMHGKTSLIYHRYHAMFERTPSPFIAARYHSLVADLPPAEVSDDLIITAWTEDEVIMGIAHTTLPLYGIQFHPESFLTQYGFVLIENFLKLGPLKIPRHSTDEGKLHG